MPRLGGMFGPDVTFLGVERCDLSDPEQLKGADAVIIGAPYDAGASYRGGARFGPKMIRTTDYLPHDSSRPHLALRVDPLQDLRVLDAGDVEMQEVVQRGLDAVMEEAFAIAVDDCDGVFVSVDVDVVDPGTAPGTGTPEPGGLTGRQLLDTVRRIAIELPVVGIDVVEVSPPYDTAEITAFLANRVVLEMLSGILYRRGGGTWDSIPKTLLEDRL